MGTVQDAMVSLWIVCGFLSLSPVVCNKHILILSLDTWSHIVKPLSIAEHLDKYGHKMDFVLMSPKYQENVLKYKIKSLTVQTVSGMDTKEIDEVMKQSFDSFCKYQDAYGSVGRAYDLFRVYSFMPQIVVKLCEDLMSNEKLMSSLKQASYDAVIIDSMFAVDACHNLLAYKLGIPAISVGSFPSMHRFAAPVFPATMPIFFYSQRLTFFQRLINFVFIYTTSLFPSFFLPSSFATKYVPEKPPVSIHSLIQNASLYLIDQDPLMDIPRPAMPNMKFVGGLAVRDGKKLPETFQKWMDNAQQGVIIMSFGSIIHGIKKEHINKFIEAFSKSQEYRFVFKHGNTTEVIGGNILKSGWIPQNDLLAHPNTKLFITHCGNNGRMEALFHGVPMLGIPLLGDQEPNCKQMEAKQYGKCLEFCEISADDIFNSIKEILSGPYSSNIKKASKIFRSHEKKPSERAAKYIDHFLQHGNDYLRNPALELPWYQLYSVDVLACLTTVVVFVAYVIVHAARYIKNKFLEHKPKQD